MYGHVVASDMFAEAYVMPLKAVLQEIETQFGADSICIPTMAEVRKWSRDRTKDFARFPIPRTTDRAVSAAYQRHNAQPSSHALVSSILDDSTTGLHIENNVNFNTTGTSHIGPDLPKKYISDSLETGLNRLPRKPVVGMPKSKSESLRSPAAGIAARLGSQAINQSRPQYSPKPLPESGLNDIAPPHPGSPSNSNYGDKDGVPIICSNWKPPILYHKYEDYEDPPLCNDCGRHLAAHGRNHSVSLKTDVIVKRNYEIEGQLLLGSGGNIVGSQIYDNVFFDSFAEVPATDSGYTSLNQSPDLGCTRHVSGRKESVECQAPNFIRAKEHTFSPSFEVSCNKLVKSSLT